MEQKEAAEEETDGGFEVCMPSVADVMHAGDRGMRGVQFCSAARECEYAILTQENRRLPPRSYPRHIGPVCV